MCCSPTNRAYSYAELAVSSQRWPYDHFHSVFHNYKHPENSNLCYRLCFILDRLLFLPPLTATTITGMAMLNIKCCNNAIPQKTNYKIRCVTFSVTLQTESQVDRWTYKQTDKRNNIISFHQLR